MSLTKGQLGLILMDKETTLLSELLITLYGSKKSIVMSILTYPAEEITEALKDNGWKLGTIKDD